MGGKENFTKSGISLTLAKKLTPFSIAKSSNDVHLYPHLYPHPLIVVGELNELMSEVSLFTCAFILFLLLANSASASIPFLLHYQIFPFF